MSARCSYCLRMASSHSYDWPCVNADVIEVSQELASALDIYMLRQHFNDPPQRRTRRGWFRRATE